MENLRIGERVYRDKAIHETIRQNYGIELNWSEKWALRYYIHCFRERGDSFSMAEGIEWFMNDFFGLNHRRLGKDPRRVIGPRNMLEYTIDTGMELLGTAPFREYCRRHVNEWREQRGLI